MTECNCKYKGEHAREVLMIVQIINEPKFGVNEDKRKSDWPGFSKKFVEMFIQWPLQIQRSFMPYL